MKKHSKRYNQQEDDALLPYIRELVDQRGSYGYRRIKTLLNHKLKNTGKNSVNHKRVYRIMKQNNLLEYRNYKSYFLQYSPTTNPIFRA